MAKVNGTFVMRELYERLGIYDLPTQDQDQLNTLIAHWRVHYQTKDGRLGSDLVNYHHAKADLNTMAQHFLDHNSNGSNYWRYDKQKVTYDKDADEIKQLLGQVFCQKNANAAKSARRSQKEKGHHKKDDVAPLPTVSDVAVPDTSQSQDQSGEMSNDEDSYTKCAKYDDHYDMLRRSSRKRTPSIWMADSEKRLKISQPQSKPYDNYSRCKRLHSKCNGAQQCIRCTKIRAQGFRAKLTSSAGLNAEGDVTTHQTDPVTVAAPAALLSPPATAPVTPAEPAAAKIDISTPVPTATVAPYSTRVNSPDWQSELLPQIETNTVDDVTHQRGETNTEGNAKDHSEKRHQRGETNTEANAKDHSEKAHGEDTNTEAQNTDQTPKPKASTTFMVLTRTPRRKIKTYWAEGSLSGKTLREIFHETEALVGRVNTEEINFELKGSQTGHRYRIHTGDQKAFEHMRRAFNQEAKHELKKGHCEFEIWLELIGGTEHGDEQTDNENDEQSEGEEVF